jgi:hypothetical protein
MRSYKKRFAREFIRTQQRHRIETRDAILFSIDEVNYLAGIKIQGTDALIYAHFPRNLRAIPKWMKLGNAVRVRHRGGIGSFIEILGPGRAVPVAVPGGTVWPDLGTATDVIISGLTLSAANPGVMAVYVAAGYYRINEVVYAHNIDDSTIMTMTDPTDNVMGVLVDGSHLVMGVGGTGGLTRVDLDAAPSEGSFRYDAIAIGADGTLDYLKGTTFTTTPTYPSIPADHLQIGQYILVIGGVTGVTNVNIGQSFTSKQTSSILINDDTPGQIDFPWSAVTDTPVLTLVVKFQDQYGWALSDDYFVTVDWLTGTGGMRYDGSVYTQNDIQAEFTGSQFTFYVQRDQLATEIDPFLYIKVKDNNGTVSALESATGIVLLDSNGDPLNL